MHSSPRPSIRTFYNTRERTVPVPAALDLTSQALRTRLDAIAGVESVLIDDTLSTICLICDPQPPTGPIVDAARQVVNEFGLEGADLQAVVRADSVIRHRVRFIKAERVPEADNHTRIKVTLEWHEQPIIGEAVGEAGEFIENKTAAHAALDALEKLVDQDLGVRVVGVKTVRAFDTDVMVVSLLKSGSPSHRLVGAVANPPDGRSAAAIAVLNALNRMLGNYAMK